MVFTLSPSDKTYSTLCSDFSKEFKTGNTKPASALLWAYNGLDHFGLRVEVPSIMKEFTNGMLIGKDPDGTLFFYDISDLDKPQGVKFNIYYNTVADDERAFVIDFYMETPDRVFAKFLARDLDNEVNYLISSDTLKAGGDLTKCSWRSLAAGSVAAHVTKQSSVDPKWTITVPSLGITATINADIAAVNAIVESVDTWGLLTFMKVGDISNGLYADYADDRIIFTNLVDLTPDFKAYFIPAETVQKKKPLGDYEFHGIYTAWTVPS